MLRRRTVSADIEKKIITGLIISDQFSKSIVPMLHIEYFSADYARHLVKWILDYYNKYKKAPQKHIKDIFDLEKETVKEPDEILISDLLSSLSAEYENNNFNAVNGRS